MERILRGADFEQGEHLEGRKIGHGQVGELAGAGFGDAERRREAEDGRRQRVPCVPEVRGVGDLELPEVGE